jgi:hypothetical protein
MAAAFCIIALKCCMRHVTTLLHFVFLAPFSACLMMIPSYHERSRFHYTNTLLKHLLTITSLYSYDIWQPLVSCSSAANSLLNYILSFHDVTFLEYWQPPHQASLFSAHKCSSLSPAFCCIVSSSTDAISG